MKRSSWTIILTNILPQNSDYGSPFGKKNKIKVNISTQRSKHVNAGKDERMCRFCKTQISTAREDTSGGATVTPANNRVPPVLCQLHNDGSSCGEDNEGHPQHGAAETNSFNGCIKHVYRLMVHTAFTWWISPPAASQRSKFLSSGVSRFQIWNIYNINTRLNTLANNDLDASRAVPIL